MYLIKKFFMILAGMYIFFIPMTSYASDYEIIYNIQELETPIRVSGLAEPSFMLRICIMWIRF